MEVSSILLAPGIALTKRDIHKGAAERTSFGLYLSLVWEKSDPVFTVTKVLWVEVKLFMWLSLSHRDRRAQNSIQGNTTARPIEQTDE